MLSSHEQRVLDELERSLATGSPHAVRSRAGSRWPSSGVRRLTGIATVAVLGSASVLLLLSGVAVAALALSAATAVGWLFCRLCLHRSDAPSAVPALGGTDASPSRTKHRFGASVRSYLTWLAETE